MPENKISTKKIKVIPFVIIILFIILGLIGISLDEPSRVLNQATQICLSCIGIG
jgi:hypothetical protein